MIKRLLVIQKNLLELGWPLKVSIIIYFAVGLYVAVYFLCTPHSSPFMRGQKIAHDLGCIGCHESQTSSVTANPASLRGVIPSFHSGAVVSAFWVQDLNEFREWVVQGASNRNIEERKKFSASDTSGAIKMPAYGSTLSSDQISDLYAYYNHENNFKLPNVGAVAQGVIVAEQHGCFACHGPYGLSGLSNPGSFKGYIPPWEGEDFNELVHDDQELKEWIHTGSLKRISHNLFGKYFLYRQKIHMPAYGDMLNDQEVNDLVSYVHWLSGKDKSEFGTVDEKKDSAPIFSRGETLFKNTGCVTCHKLTGAEGFTDRYELELPPRSRLAYKLKNFADIIKERESQSRWTQSKLCGSYTDFSNEYKNIEQIILKGLSDTEKPVNTPDQQYEDIKHLTPMPSWEDRANADGLATAMKDIDSIIGQLLMDNDSTVTQELIEQWRATAKSCVIKKNEHPIIDAENRRQQIKNRIDFLDKKEKLFDNLRLVTFFSYEVGMVDQVGYLKDKELDLWLLYQSEKKPDLEKMLAEGRFPKLVKYVIAVDKMDVNYSAYFFINGDKNNPPTFKGDHFIDAPMDNCFGCHASGSRKLRPAIDKDIPGLDIGSWKIIHGLNKLIGSYGRVTTEWPATQKPLDKACQEPVTMPACQTCHDSNSIRAPVLRYHSRTLASVIDAYEKDDGYFVKRTPGQIAVMPPVLPLTDSGRLDLLDWTNLSEMKRKRPRNKTHT